MLEQKLSSIQSPQSFLPSHHRFSSRQGPVTPQDICPGLQRGSTSVSVSKRNANGFGLGASEYGREAFENFDAVYFRQDSTEVHHKELYKTSEGLCVFIYNFFREATIHVKLIYCSANDGRLMINYSVTGKQNKNNRKLLMNYLLALSVIQHIFNSFHVESINQRSPPPYAKDSRQ